MTLPKYKIYKLRSPWTHFSLNNYYSGATLVSQPEFLFKTHEDVDSLHQLMTTTTATLTNTSINVRDILHGQSPISSGKFYGNIKDFRDSEHFNNHINSTLTIQNRNFSSVNNSTGRNSPLGEAVNNTGSTVATELVSWSQPS